MNLMLTASSKHEDLVKELRIDMEKNLEPEFHPNECCIYRVNKSLRDVNKQAYTPQMVSIGPLHHGNKRLENMEKKKRNYMKCFLEKRITIEKQDDIFSFVQMNENNIRNCYAEISKLKSHEYIMMILYDVIFIIELFIRVSEGTSDSILSTTSIRQTLMLDLELLENQLPYFVLEEIHKLASYSDMRSFMDISCSFFGYFNNCELIKLTPGFSVKHFIDWKRSTLLEKYKGSSKNEGYIEGMPCATKLHESGVKFKKTEQERKPLFKKDGHELQLPHIEIVDGHECMLRNVIALEQHLYPKDTHICNYVQLMDCLIDDEKDVDLLVGSGIISNSLGDNSSVANMFNKLGQNINLSRSFYYDMCEELKVHCDNRWNKAMATLRRVYFSNLWRGTGTIAAVILLLLTVMQTICSILQVV
ncbi:UPF0481 protein At3g47200-like [Mangifera indica]|uniref:UPF0481 protein At3g47200-like n=1 Tax=Mangifera indica TaxID=29780 RepID=UPI001CFB2B92|nr:UPF0481 protein At3g47200-like [Mangifera indica]